MTKNLHIILTFTARVKHLVKLFKGEIKVTSCSCLVRFKVCSRCWRSSCCWMDSAWPRNLTAASAWHSSLLLYTWKEKQASAMRQKATWSSNLSRPPTWPDEERPRRRWFHLWRWSRRTGLRTPAGARWTASVLFWHPKVGGVCVNFSAAVGVRSYSPWLTSLRANCWHRFPQDAAREGPLCFQQHIWRFYPRLNPGPENKWKLWKRMSALWVRSRLLTTQLRKGECVHTHLDLIHPRSHVQEAAFRSDVVEEKDAVSFTEVGPGNAAKPTEKGAWIYTQQWILYFFFFIIFFNKMPHEVLDLTVLPPKKCRRV